MTKLQLLHRALNERLMAAVEQIMEMVGCTVLEYEEETTRVRKENEVLRRRLRWMEGAIPTDRPGPSEPGTLSTPDESNPSQQEESAVSFRFELGSEGLVFKTESIDHPLNVRPESSLATLPQSTDQGSAVAGTSAGVDYGLTDGMTWESYQSYMAPLDFDPASNSSVRRWRERSRRQRMSFACPDCGKVFGSKRRLIFHMRIHSAERPYSYRRRKACFYGNKNKRNRKLHGLSQPSQEIAEDLTDGSEKTAPEQEQASSTTESDTSSDKEPQNSTANPLHLVHRKRGRKIMPRCPHCSRVFTRPGRLEAHIKRHMMEARRHPVNLPNTTSSRNEMVDEKRKPPKVVALPQRCFSKVWDYFSKDEFGEVFCHTCFTRISQGSNNAAMKNTSNLWSHLRSKHKSKYLEAKGFSSQVNVLMNALDTTVIKLEHSEPEERVVEGESEIRNVLIPEEPHDGNV
ncbi:zinc finger and SCAN domain-containing protein 10 isoform X2 [Myxocyprinus asiaticus]|uniref:zinc finger and SCAN domain-containing protein 10 isoform X2 n=1 Tax=Myxocyprinus asiaticus TaxID=70543 RepID=UPI002222D2DE|nr:zinc finger and SCAN domain-containing protein 10 isoform X2 [Myxocyprinus asiaticus]